MCDIVNLKISLIVVKVQIHGMGGDLNSWPVGKKDLTSMSLRLSCMVSKNLPWL